MSSIDSRPREPENGPVKVLLTLQEDKLVFEVSREVQDRIRHFAQSIQNQLDGEILARFIHRGSGFISEWLNSGSSPISWLGSAQAVREFIASGCDKITIPEVFEPSKLTEVLERYFARDEKRPQQCAADPELLGFLLVRQLQLKDTVLEVTHPSLHFVALSCLFVDGAVTSRKYFIAERPRQYFQQMLQRTAELNPEVREAIHWVIQHWTELSKQGYELRHPTADPVVDSLFPATYDDFERMVEKGISLANEVLRADLQIRGVVTRAAEREPSLWSDPAHTIARSMKHAGNQVVVIDDQSEYGLWYRAPKSVTHLARFRAQLLQELDKTAGFSTWAILDGRKQWGKVLVEGLKMGAMDLPTVERVLESVRFMASARYAPDGANELLKAVQISQCALTPETAPKLEFWCKVLEGARKRQAQIVLYDSKDFSKSNPFGQGAFSSFMKLQLERGERVALLSEDAEQVGLPRLSASDRRKVALFSGLTSNGCVSEFRNRMVFLHAINEVMMQSAGASVGAEQCAGLHVNTPAFRDEMQNIRGGEREAVLLDWFGGEYDFIVVAGGRKDSDRAYRPGRGKKRFMPIS